MILGGEKGNQEVVALEEGLVDLGKVGLALDLEEVDFVVVIRVGEEEVEMGLEENLRHIFLYEYHNLCRQRA